MIIILDSNTSITTWNIERTSLKNSQLFICIWVIPQYLRHRLRIFIFIADICINSYSTAKNLYLHILNHFCTNSSSWLRFRGFKWKNAKMAVTDGTNINLNNSFVLMKMFIFINEAVCTHHEECYLLWIRKKNFFWKIITL